MDQFVWGCPINGVSVSLAGCEGKLNQEQWMPLRVSWIMHKGEWGGRYGVVKLGRRKYSEDCWSLGWCSGRRGKLIWRGIVWVEERKRKRREEKGCFWRGFGDWRRNGLWMRGTAWFA
jgi:hypothetical protein